MALLKRRPAKPDRSPLKDKPLRQAGQSLDEQIIKFIGDDVLDFVVIACVLGYFTFMEWLRYLFDISLHPLVWTAMFFTVAICAGYKIYRALPRVRQLRQARDGERAVGEFLERLRNHGYQVFHDLVGDNFNVDHVIIGPTGVYTVETKTISKPPKGRAEVIYNGEEITVGGFKPDRDPLIQARAQAGWLKTLLQESTGKGFPVRSLVVYPGWFVILKGHISQRDVLVMNPKQIPDFLSKLEVKLSPEEVKIATYHLSRHIRTSEKAA